MSSLVTSEEPSQLPLGASVEVPSAAVVSSTAMVSSAYCSSSDSECAPDMLTLLQDPAARMRIRDSVQEATQKKCIKRERMNK